MSITEQIIKGRYIYKKNGHVYSEEDFKIFHEEHKQGNFIINSEVSSRVANGEFLQIFIEYTLSCTFDPVSLIIRRSMGRENSVEKFIYHSTENLIKYSIRGSKGEGSYDKHVSGKFFISAPCAVTSMMMSLSKKVSPIYRTAYDIISSKNVWGYQAPIEENTIHIEQIQAEPVGISIQNKELNAFFYQMFENEKGSGIIESPISFYLSKFMNIPYRIKIPEDIVIETEFIKNTESKYKGIF